jgi:hypothetical protein
MEISPRNLDELFVYANINKLEDKEERDSFTYPKIIYTPYDYEILLLIERIKNYKLFKNKEKN